MAGAVILRMCDACRLRVERFPYPPEQFKLDAKGNEWGVLPDLCPECSAKLCQIARLMLAGAALLPGRLQQAKPSPNTLEPCRRTGGPGDWWTEPHVSCTGRRHLEGGVLQLCGCACHRDPRRFTVSCTGNGGP